MLYTYNTSRPMYDVLDEQSIYKFIFLSISIEWAWDSNVQSTH